MSSAQLFSESLEKTTVSGVGAVVVLYRPDQILLQRLASVVGQVGAVYVIDNTPGGRREDYGTILDVPEVLYHPLHENLGIATAHNRGIELARRDGLSHVLLMDQDSALAPETVARLVRQEARLLEAGMAVAAVGPVFVDDKTGDPAPAIVSGLFGPRKTAIDLAATEPVRSTYIIASGSLIRLSVLERIGGMQDNLFIDFVDIEWGERAALAGYGCYLVPSVTMKHSIGDEFVTLLGRRVLLHSDFRKYFIVRNAVFLALWSSLSVSTRLQLVFKVPYYLGCYSWYSAKRASALRLLLGAVADGVRKRMGKGRFQ
jgi:rhamnosyltransferase